MSTQRRTTVELTPAPAFDAPIGNTRLGRTVGSNRIPAWWGDAVGSATWLSVLAVVALWTIGHGVQDLGALASALTSLGRLSGLLCADLLLIQVLLMARIPLVERVYGQDELARRHRLVGIASVSLMVLHIVLITAGYAAQDRIGLLRQLWELVRIYPGVLLAAAGSVLLLMVGATSARRARRRLRYESWHLLHLYAYLGVALAVPHQLWTGRDFLTSSVASIYWWTLWIAALSAILIWRVGVPAYRSLSHRLRVAGVVQESPEVVSVWLSGRNLSRFPGAAGQFFIWRFLDGPGWTRGHPYSLSAPPGGGLLRITVKALGDGSRALRDLRPGTRVLIEGPYGRLHEGVRTRHKVTLVAGGIGITPLRALVEQLAQAPGDLTLIYRARSTSELVFTRELAALAAGAGVHLFYLIGPRIQLRSSWLPQSAAHLRDEDAFRELVPDIAEHDVYICGAAAWMVAVRAAALGAGVPPSNIHLERFSW